MLGQRRKKAQTMPRIIMATLLVLSVLAVAGAGPLRAWAKAYRSGRKRGWI